MPSNPVDLRNLCVLQDDIHTFTRTEQVVHLSDLLKSTSENAESFFQKNHVTSGMKELLRGALQRLAGETQQAIWSIQQAMGGGKTHNMLALGMIANNPQLSRYLPDDITEGFSLVKARIIAINGRSIDEKGQLIGEMARQLGKEMQWQYKWNDGLSSIQPMSEQDWIDMIGHQPTLIMMDEMAPYLAQSITRRVGEGTLLDVLIYSLSNLFSAAMKLPNTALVISSLDAAYEDVTRAVTGKLSDLKKEASRGAKTITPVDLNTDEIYAILKKRLFKSLPDEEQILEIADMYRSAMVESIKSGILSKTSESLCDEIPSSYPFHPSYKDILALFKDNDKFRQTRGLIEFSANLVRCIFDSDDDQSFVLAGVQHLDFADIKTRDQVKDIERTLESALMKDVYDNDGSAHAQQLDYQKGDYLASQLASLIFAASLSDNADGIKGLAENTLQEYLVEPGVGAKQVSDRITDLKKVCWYLHQRDDRWYFSDNANLKKRLDDKVKHANIEQIKLSLKKRIEEMFKPVTKTAYTRVIALPTAEEVELNVSNRLCLVLAPDNMNPPEVASRIFEHAIYKNAFCVISSDHSKMATLEELTKRLWAIEVVSREQGGNERINSEIQQELEEVNHLFNSAFESTFNKVYFPHQQRGMDLIRETTLSLSQARDEKSKAIGERAVINALSGMAARKLIPLTDSKGVELEGEARMEEIEKLISRAEDMLFTPEQSRIKLSTFRERAAVNCGWPWLPPKVLDEVKSVAVSKGRWTHDAEDYVDCKPKPPAPSLTCSVVSENLDTGTFELQVTGSNLGPNAKIYVSNSPDPASTGEELKESIYKTQEVELFFQIVDPDFHEEIPSKPWKGRIAMDHDVQKIGDRHLVTLYCSAPDAQMYWSTNGVYSKDTNQYDDAKRIDLDAAQSTTLYVLACKGNVTEEQCFLIKGCHSEGPAYDPAKPIMLNKPIQSASRQVVFSILDAASKEGDNVQFQGLQLLIGEGSDCIRFNAGSKVSVTGKAALALLESLKVVMDHSNTAITLMANKTRFADEYTMQRFASKAGVDVPSEHLVQANH